jgi:hypothetical protein
MDGMEEKLGALLNDPGSMAQIMALAQNLGLGKGPAEAASGAPSAPSAPDDAMLKSVMGMMAGAKKSEAKQEALFQALKPFLREERRAKIDRALQVARISHIAGFALRNFEKKP